VACEMAAGKTGTDEAVDARSTVSIDDHCSQRHCARMGQPREGKRTQFDPAGSIERHCAWLRDASSGKHDAVGDAWSLMRAHLEDGDPRARGVARSLRWLALGQLDRLQAPGAVAARATRDRVAEFRAWVEQAPGLAMQLESWLAQAREIGGAVTEWRQRDEPGLVADDVVQSRARCEDSSLDCLTPELFAHVEHAVQSLKLIAAIPRGLVADPTAPGKRKDVLRNAIAELKLAGFSRAEDISPLIDDCYGDGDASTAKLKRLREFLRSC